MVWFLVILRTKVTILKLKRLSYNNFSKVTFEYPLKAIEKRQILFNWLLSTSSVSNVKQLFLNLSHSPNLAMCK